MAAVPRPGDIRQLNQTSDITLKSSWDGVGGPIWRQKITLTKSTYFIYILHSSSDDDIYIHSTSGLTIISIIVSFSVFNPVL